MILGVVEFRVSHSTTSLFATFVVGSPTFPLICYRRPLSVRM
jgi:hypothetical protein